MSSTSRLATGTSERQLTLRYSYPAALLQQPYSADELPTDKFRQVLMVDGVWDLIWKFVKEAGVYPNRVVMAYPSYLIEAYMLWASTTVIEPIATADVHMPPFAPSVVSRNGVSALFRSTDKVFLLSHLESCVR